MVGKAQAGKVLRRFTLRNHNGLSVSRKKKFIDEFLKAYGLQKNIKRGRRRNPFYLFFTAIKHTLAGCSPAEPASVLIDLAKMNSCSDRTAKP